MQLTHHLIAGLSHQPHWRLNDPDAKQYGTAIANMMRHFSPVVSQKSLDIFACGLCVVAMETPRIQASVELAKMRRTRGTSGASSASSPPIPGATVYPFPVPPTVSPSPPPPSTAAVQPAAAVGGFVPDGVDGPIGGAP